MKHALLKTKSRLIMSLMIVIMSVVYTSCDDTETTDSTKFTIFYSGMTDIGPSMSGRISSPTYKGNTPSDFAITKVTLKGEAYSGDCFTIDPNDGFISINSTKDMQVGLYKLSISCWSISVSFLLNLRSSGRHTLVSALGRGKQSDQESKVITS